MHARLGGAVLVCSGALRSEAEKEAKLKEEEDRIRTSKPLPQNLTEHVGLCPKTFPRLRPTCSVLFGSFGQQVSYAIQTLYNIGNVVQTDEVARHNDS